MKSQSSLATAVLAPSSMGCLGTNADPNYVPYLREKLAEALAAAEANLEPAQVGWAVAGAERFTALRRWIRRPDRIAEVQAEPKIAETALGLLEEVAGRSRRDFKQSRGPASASLLKAKPAAYWRLDEIAVFDRALEAKEIESLRAGSPKAQRGRAMSVPRDEASTAPATAFELSAACGIGAPVDRAAPLQTT